MKFITVLAALAAPMVAHANIGDESKFEVTGTMTLDYSAGVFTATLPNKNEGSYAIGNANAAIIMQLYDKCPHGEPPTNDAKQIYTSETSGSPGWLAPVSSSGTAGTETKFSFSVGPGVAGYTIGGNPIYTESGNVGTVTMCMKITLRHIHGGLKYHVNFREMEITITYDLSAGFTEPKAFKVNALDPITDSLDDLDIQLDVSDCTPSPASSPYTQGTWLCSKICPKPGNPLDVKVTGLSWMKAKTVPVSQLLAPAPTNDVDSQDIWNGGAAGHLTQPTLDNDGKCKKVWYFLKGNFFAYSISDNSETAVVGKELPQPIQLNGVAYVSALRRNLKGEVEEVIRELAINEESEFSSSVLIERTPLEESGASDSGKLAGAAAAAAVAGAALLL